MVHRVLPGVKSTEMNVPDLELFKKSKIIEIGSVEKKLRLFKVEGISKKSQNPEIFVNEIQAFLQKLSQISKNLKIVKKFFDCFSFRFDALTLIFGIL